MIERVWDGMTVLRGSVEGAWQGAMRMRGLIERIWLRLVVGRGEQVVWLELFNKMPAYDFAGTVMV